MNDRSRSMNRSFGIWQPPIPAPLPPVTEELMVLGNPRPAFSAGGAKPGRAIWKARKGVDKRKRPAAAAGGGASGYKPAAVSDLQFQNRAKAFRFYPNRKKFARFAPFAPRNTTSFIIRAKKAGGIASLVSPCPVTPAILPTPKFSPSREDLVDMAKEEWGVDGYGSMKGLIRLRANETMRGEEEDDVDESSGSSEVEEHVEVERRLDHDLSRFEMVFYRGAGDERGGRAAGYPLENRVDDQDAHIAQLEEENLTLKERLFLMETEMGDLRRRLQLLETHCRVREDNNDDDNNASNNVNPNEESSNNEGGGGDVSSEQSVGDLSAEQKRPATGGDAEV